jgi:uncharacterized protein
MAGLQVRVKGIIHEMADKKKTKREPSGLKRPAQQGFHLMAKPAGPSCNLRCVYCFYLEKKTFFEEDKNFLMSDEVLEAYTREYIKSQAGPSVEFDWQGGEPSLLGVAFFERALAFQKKYGKGRQILNSLQTNGTLIDEEWCAFLSKNKFLVGLSMDGPDAVHDACRVDMDGNPTCARVSDALKLMQKHGVEVNILATINSESSRHPLEVYRFFRESGARFIQFIPIIEREAGPEAEKPGIALAVPPSLTHEEKSIVVTPWSVQPEQYAEFFIRIFDEWIKNDVGKVFVMNFEWSLAAWAGVGPGMCYLSPRCGRNLILEHNGDIYSCDHFMYPAYRLGNILDGGLRKMVDSKKQTAFGASKETALPGYCRKCDALSVCRGGCPKHRFAKSPDGEPGLNYLCAGFKKFYNYVHPSMIQMVELINRGVPVQKIMEATDKAETFG